MRFAETYIALQEFPDEITLAINISNCPFRCEGCHSPWLWEDKGQALTAAVLDELIDNNPGISCVGLMGGDRYLEQVEQLARHIKTNHPELKVGMYSGRKTLFEFKNLLQILDYIKIGPYVQLKGGLNSISTNQVFYKVDHMDKGYSLNDWTYKFHKP